jgi:hypothetical protein
MLGRMKRVENLDRARGENNAYLFVKVQLPYGAEEYWLLTDQEAQLARETWAYRQLPPQSREGVVDLAEDPDELNERTWYVVGLRYGAETRHYAFDNLERIRRRVERNNEDIEANREGWLADLLD